ncbi:MAG: hypothetical protein DMG26_08770 [Acidobacteria bacterium]|nr:MAG: hypothetical protein DMG26_08770 [Acidobacteriota bacterium]
MQDVTFGPWLAIGNLEVMTGAIVLHQRILDRPHQDRAPTAGGVARCSVLSATPYRSANSAARKVAKNESFLDA